MSSSTVTYTSISSDSDLPPWGFHLMDPAEFEAPSSPDYVSGPEHPPSPDYVPGPEEPEQAPLSPDYVPEPEYPEYLVPSDAEAPIEDHMDLLSLFSYLVWHVKYYGSLLASIALGLYFHFVAEGQSEALASATYIFPVKQLVVGNQNQFATYTSERQEAQTWWNSHVKVVGAYIRFTLRTTDPEEGMDVEYYILTTGLD
ncbi:hypothetical protein Tco_0498695 [Tanacetum coccineum]